MIDHGSGVGVVRKSSSALRKWLKQALRPCCRQIGCVKVGKVSIDLGCDAEFLAGMMAGVSMDSRAAASSLVGGG